VKKGNQSLPDLEILKKVLLVEGSVDKKAFLHLLT